MCLVSGRVVASSRESGCLAMSSRCQSLSKSVALRGAGLSRVWCRQGVVTYPLRYRVAKRGSSSRSYTSRPSCISTQSRVALVAKFTAWLDKDTVPRSATDTAAKATLRPVQMAKRHVGAMCKAAPPRGKNTHVRMDKTHTSARKKHTAAERQNIGRKDGADF